MAVSMSDANTSMHAGLVSPLPQNSTQLPQEFVEADQKHLSNAELESIEDPELDFPVLDLSLLSGDKKHHDEVITAAAEACQNWGFFQIQNHGIDQRLIEKCKEEALRMFQLPLEAKKRCDRPPGTSFGYGSNTWVNQKVQHWAESFHLQLKPMSNVPAMASKLFPDQTSSQQFSSVVEEYMETVQNLAIQVVEILTEGLGLPPAYFSQHLQRERMVSMRLNFYPPCPEPSKAIGLRAHTDPHLITILHQDTVRGLQVQVAEKWVTVKPRPDCFVVNIGDIFQILSNTRYKSGLHRAVVNGQFQRLSMACFLNLPLDCVVAAPPELITTDCPQKYRPFLWLEYLKHAYLYHPITGNDRHEKFFLKPSGDIPVAASSVH
uniref:GA20 oxidase-like protein n=1 Tax=Physcomitrium patens TaxID=3218 RepID=B3XXH2_PHYPA|nr:GA20 oxidase-like protein [Physcomitrium patens]